MNFGASTTGFFFFFLASLSLSKSETAWQFEQISFCIINRARGVKVVLMDSAYIVRGEGEGVLEKKREEKTWDFLSKKYFQSLLLSAGLPGSLKNEQPNQAQFKYY